MPGIPAATRGCVPALRSHAAVGPGGQYIARHVIGCHLTQNPRVLHACRFQSV